MVYITTDEVALLCRYSISLYRGKYGLLDVGKLESAIESVKVTWEGEPLLKTIEEVAAGYWFSICQAHAFIDGNKRAALLAVDRFLHLNDLELDLTSNEAEQITMQISTGTITSREELVPMIRTRLLDLSSLE